jgi:hypothetical protein
MSGGVARVPLLRRANTPLEVAGLVRLASCGVDTSTLVLGDVTVVASSRCC